MTIFRFLLKILYPLLRCTRGLLFCPKSVVATIFPVGKNTFGKGSVQELVKITSESSFKVTVAHWLTPNGKSISDGGIPPDIKVEITKEDFEAKKDPQLEEAIKLLLQ